jgi:hypothetical protein
MKYKNQTPRAPELIARPHGVISPPHTTYIMVNGGKATVSAVKACSMCGPFPDSSQISIVNYTCTFTTLPPRSVTSFCTCFALITTITLPLERRVLGHTPAARRVYLKSVKLRRVHVMLFRVC